MVPRRLVLYVVGGRGRDGEGFLAERDLVDVVPVRAEREVVGAVDLVHCRVDGVVGG